MPAVFYQKNPTFRLMKIYVCIGHLAGFVTGIYSIPNWNPHPPKKQPCIAQHLNSTLKGSDLKESSVGKHDPIVSGPQFFSCFLHLNCVVCHLFVGRREAAQ